jgi:hypothetical protein
MAKEAIKAAEAAKTPLAAGAASDRKVYMHISIIIIMDANTRFS